MADVDVAARRLLTMIDGLGAQMVVRAVPSDEAKHIAQSYFTSELGCGPTGLSEPAFCVVNYLNRHPRSPMLSA